MSLTPFIIMNRVCSDHPDTPAANFVSFPNNELRVEPFVSLEHKKACNSYEKLSPSSNDAPKACLGLDHWDNLHIPDRVKISWQIEMRGNDKTFEPHTPLPHNESSIVTQWNMDFCAFAKT